jgi:hypothetical protein
LIESRFVWSATFVIVVTARLMLAARSLITASLAPNDDVLSASCRIVVSMPSRLPRPSAAMSPVCAAMSFTSVIVRTSSWLVTEISLTAATASLVEAP